MDCASELLFKLRGVSCTQVAWCKHFEQENGRSDLTQSGLSVLVIDPQD